MDFEQELLFYGWIIAIVMPVSVFVTFAYGCFAGRKTTDVQTALALVSIFVACLPFTPIFLYPMAILVQMGAHSESGQVFTPFGEFLLSLVIFSYFAIGYGACCWVYGCSIIPDWVKKKLGYQG